MVFPGSRISSPAVQCTQLSAPPGSPMGSASPHPHPLRAARAPQGDGGASAGSTAQLLQLSWLCFVSTAWLCAGSVTQMLGSFEGGQCPAAPFPHALSSSFPYPSRNGIFVSALQVCAPGLSLVRWCGCVRDKSEC